MSVVLTISLSEEAAQRLLELNPKELAGIKVLSLERVGCSGQHDDGIADGNLTNCSRRSGCGLEGCPYKAPP